MIGFGFSVFTQAILGLGGGFRGSALNLDFTSGNRVLDPRVTFSRTTNATLTNSAGLVAYAPHNLLTFSEQFDNAAWVKVSATVSANAVAAPNGTTTADFLIPSVASSPHAVAAATGGSSGAGSTYTLSVYAKANGYDFISLALQNGAITAGNETLQNFNLATGTVASSFNTAPTSASITSVGNGWYRCVVTWVISTTTANPAFFVVNTDSNPRTVWTANGTSGIYIWGAQLELGSTATTYNPTTVKNLMGYTEHFDNAAWTKSNALVQTNFIRNNTMQGAVAGTPGTQPTFWPISSSGNGVAREIVGSGNESGVAYIDVRFFGTPTAGNNVTAAFEAANALPATTGQTWTGSSYIALVSGSLSGTTPTFSLLETNGIAGTLDNAVAIAPTGGALSGKRLTFTATLGGLGTTNIQPRIRIGYTVGVAFDITLRIGLPQLVQGASAGDVVLTYAAAAAVGYTDIYGQPFAQKLVETAATGTHFVFQNNVALLAGTTYTLSCYLKAGERNWAIVSTYGSAVWGSNDGGVFINLSTGALGNTFGTAGAVSVTDVGNGWYRVTTTRTAQTSGTQGMLVAVAQANGSSVPSYTGDGTSGIYIFGAQLSDSASVDPYVYNPVAAPSAAAYYGPRFDYDPVTLAPKGLLIEEQRTNLLLNSSVLSTQIVTVTAAAHTLSFYGTGTIVLSGAYTGTVTGTGAYPTRTTLTFTPIVGALTATVTGSVTMAQLEAGAFATSYIPTVASQVTRAADIATMTGNNFARWYNQSEGATFAEYSGRNGGRVFMADDGTTNNRYEMRISANTSQLSSWSGGVQDISGLFAPAAVNLPDGVNVKSATGMKVNNAAISTNGVPAGTDTSCAMPIGLNRMILGFFQGSGTFLNGHIRKIAYYPRRLTDAELQGITS